jgi:hypothetical protein
MCVTCIHIWCSVCFVRDLTWVAKAVRFFSLGLEVSSNGPALNTLEHGGSSTYKVLVERTPNFLNV